MNNKKIKGSEKLTSLLSILVIISIMISCFIVRPVFAQFDFNAFLGATIDDENIDGVIENEWEDASKYSAIDIDPQGTADLWIKNDETYLYIALQFTADSSNPWIAFQFEVNNHMSSGADGALFGHDRLGSNDYRDISFGGLAVISSDANQDGVGAITVEDQNLITVELKKPLNSGDSNGNDIQWSVNNQYTLIIRWDSDGGGSSEGNTNHQSGSSTDRTVYINPEEIPEFSNFSIGIMIILISVILIILKRKRL